MAEFAHEYRDVRDDEVWRHAQDAVRVIPFLEPLIPPVEDEESHEEK